jgi:ribonuclease P protein subunit RPR2
MDEHDRLEPEPEEEPEEHGEEDEGLEPVVRVEITGLSLYTHHGVDAAEREVGQRLVFDLSFDLSDCEATITDRVEDTVDYADVCQQVALAAQERSYATLERLCAAIADRMVDRYGADSVMVRATKPEPPIPLPVDEVSVEVWTEREELARVHGELARYKSEAGERERQLERYAEDLRESFKRERARAQELRDSYAATVRALANAVEARDAYTAKHAERVAAYGLELAAAVEPELGDDPQIEFGSLLHDIGKVAIPDGILYKSEPLTEQERGLMYTHPIIGWEILRGIGFLDGRAREIIRWHHEHWDGSGYPDGLAGEQIPLPARIFAVADALDALTTTRPYRPASPLAEARATIRADAGRQFDPRVVAALDTIPDEVLERIRAEIA